MTPLPAAEVSVIVPTLANADRVVSLFRAIDTVLSQRRVRATPLVIVNGSRPAAGVMERLGRRRDIRLARLPEASLPRALKAGRAMVDTEYFAELDDDDELLPEALATRLTALRDAPGVDAVITNGFLRGAGREEINVLDFTEAQTDPLRALLRCNWHVPCSGLFRTATITEEFFDDIPQYVEWTYLGLCISLRRRIVFLNCPTFVYHTDSPGAVSKSREYDLGLPGAIDRLLRMDLPRDVRPLLEARLTAAHHTAAGRELRHGDPGAAWRWHLRCLRRRHGWRYVLYTRHLIRAGWQGQPSQRVPADVR
jgi:glycosyltransferase involved in cell wall biosynthesis